MVVRCKLCGNDTTDWVDPEWADGRVCLECEARHDRLPLRIIARKMLDCGVWGRGPETIFIYVNEEQSREEAAITLWHEIVHVLMHAGGHVAPVQPDDAGIKRNEGYVEALAKRLAAACPEVVSLCGLDSKFPLQRPGSPEVLLGSVDPDRDHPRQECPDPGDAGVLDDRGS